MSRHSCPAMLLPPPGHAVAQGDRGHMEQAPTLRLLKGGPVP